MKTQAEKPTTLTTIEAIRSTRKVNAKIQQRHADNIAESISNNREIYSGDVREVNNMSRAIELLDRVENYMTLSDNPQDEFNKSYERWVLDHTFPNTHINKPALWNLICDLKDWYDGSEPVTVAILSR